MSELGLMGKTHHQMVESNMLSLLCEEKLSPGELETKILEKLPNPVRMPCGLSLGSQIPNC